MTQRIEKDILLAIYDPATDDEDEDLHDLYIEDFKLGIEEIIKENKLEYPLELCAVKSNWQEQDGYTTVEDIDDLFQKIFSFGNDSMELFQEPDASLFFRTGSHDVNSFIIRIEPEGYYDEEKE